MKRSSSGGRKKRRKEKKGTRQGSRRREFLGSRGRGSTEKKNRKKVVEDMRV